MTDSFIEFLYPKLSNQLIQKILDQYGLGQLKSWEVIPGGWSNINLLLYSQKGKFTLRIYRNGKKKKDEVLFEISVINHLKRKGLPVVEVLQTTKGQYILKQKIKDKELYLAIYKYIEGKQQTILSQKQLEKTGEMLATVDQALTDFKSKVKREVWQYMQELEKIRQKLEMQLAGKSWHFDQVVSKEKFSKLINNDFAILKQLKKNSHMQFWESSLLHGDFHAANLIFKKNKIVAVFDFESTLMGPKILDLAICIANLQIQHNDKDYTSVIFKQVVNGYKKKVSLSSGEMLILSDLVKFKIISQFVWLLTPITSLAQLKFYQQMFSKIWKVYTRS